MSKADNLKDFLIDVADAIRSKKGTTDLINPQNFSAEIAALSGGLEVIEMTETTATIEPNKVYVWGMVQSLDITLGASTGEDDFFAFRFRCSKPTMTVVTVNGATWAADTELNELGNPILDLGSYYQCEIKGGTSALYARLAHYIPFEDSNVETLLLDNSIGDGVGVTYKDAEAVQTFGTIFKNNKDITSFEELYYFNIPSGTDVFSGCSNLQKVTLPRTRPTMQSSLFYNCTSLTTINNLADNIYLTSISDRAMEKCKSITSIIIPKNVTTIGAHVFQDCTSLEFIEFPNSLKNTNGIYALKGCTKLKEIVNFENTAIVILPTEFMSDCKALTEIKFPSLLQNIKWGACLRDNALVKAVFGSELTTIGESVFQSCTALRTLVIKAINPPDLKSTNAIPSTITSIYVPDESVESYRSATNWSTYASKIKPLSEYT